MNKTKAALLVALLLTSMLIVVPVQAQSDEPPLPIVHTVQRGETLYAIAQQYSTTVDAITHANGIADPRQVYVGQRLVIPGGETGATQETIPYVVQAGDTVSSIARQHNTNWQTIVQINQLLSPNSIYAGQIIQVPRPDQPVGVELTAYSPANGNAIYTMRPNDTLFGLAMRYGVSRWTLASMGHIANPGLLYPGKELLLPSEGAGPLPEPFVSVEIQPLPVLQGRSIVIAVHTIEPVTLGGQLFGQEVHFAQGEDAYYGLAGIHVFTEPGLYELMLTAVDGDGQSTALTTEVVVEAGRFSYERIDLPESRSGLLDPAITAIEQERLDTVRFIFSPNRGWTTSFQHPCVGVISSYFGSHRAYNDGPYTSYHTGVDFRAPGGTPVYAPAAGTVVLAEQLTVRGNTIVIDHGWGLLTGYWHLSAIEVQVGDQVAAGDLIGKVGNTGLSTGAHLHWEVWVGGISVNGLQWLEEFYPWPENEGLAVGG